MRFRLFWQWQSPNPFVNNCEVKNMLIEIENTSSPGANFTDNTNSVLLKTYEWICEHNGLVLPFRDFRKRLEKEKGINDNNNRNIYPLLKNGGLVNYEKGSSINVDYFYTKTGLAYVKALETKELISSSQYSKEQRIVASQKLDDVLSNIVFGALQKIVKQPDLNYVEPLTDMIDFLIKYDKISKVEFAYLIYMKEKRPNNYLEQIEPDIMSYRVGEFEIEVAVRVRNDIDIREKTKTDKRKEGLGFLTSYGYLTGLLNQAGLVSKEGQYFEVVNSRREMLKQLGGIQNE